MDEQEVQVNPEETVAQLIEEIRSEQPYRKVLRAFIIAWLKVTLFGSLLVAVLTFFFSLDAEDQSFWGRAQVGIPIFLVFSVFGIFIFPMIVGAKMYHPIVSWFAGLCEIDVYDGEPGKFADISELVSGFSIIGMVFWGLLFMFFLIPFTIASHLFFPYILMKHILLARAERKKKTPNMISIRLISLLINVVGFLIYWIFLIMYAKWVFE